jgi:hypothetical protein
VFVDIQSDHRGGDSDKGERCEGRGISGKSDGQKLRLREKMMNMKMRGVE